MIHAIYISTLIPRPRQRLPIVIRCIVLLCAILCSCHNDGKKTQHIKIVSWNVQTFFDAVDVGTEYKDFRGSKTKWNEVAYKERLLRLCRAMKTMDADVYAFMEIENDGVIQDINNILPTIMWGKSRTWHYAVFDKRPGDAIGCAVMSRFPLDVPTSHSLDIRTHGKQPAMRNIMCVRILSGGKPLMLFVNHWKSALGGKTDTEYWRIWQEEELAALFDEYKDESAIAVGDFNRDITRFDVHGNSVSLHNNTIGKCTDVTSVWLIDSTNMSCDNNSRNIAQGSYYYNDKWEKIDHIFVNSHVTIAAFHVLDGGEWAYDDGRPRRYIIQYGTGYADHLPLMADIHW